MSKSPKRRKSSVSQAPTISNEAVASPTQTIGLAGGKIQALVHLLGRPQGATLAELMAVTGWQSHSVRGALSGAIKKKRGIAVISEKSGSERVYRISPNTGAAGEQPDAATPSDQQVSHVG